MADANTDPFAAAFTSEGFAETYSRKLRPESLDETKARHKAHAATANPLAALGLVATSEATSEKATTTPRDGIKALSDDDLKKLSDRVMDEELDRGINFTPSTPVVDEWDLPAWDEGEGE